MTKQTKEPCAPKKKRKKNNDTEALKWILKVSKPLFPSIIVIILCEALWAIFGTVTAVFSMEIINSATNDNSKKMFLFIGIYLFVALFLLLAHAVMRYITERCRARLEMLFRRIVFGKMLLKSYPKLSKFHTGELVNRLTGDVSVIADAATTIVPNVVTMTVRLVCAMTVLILLKWQFALVFGVGGIFIILNSKFLKEKIQKYHAKMQEADGKTRSFWQEIFENLVAIKAFSAEKKSVNKSDELMEKHYTLRMKRSLIGVFSMLGTGTVMRLSHLFSVSYGAFCLLNKTMDFGTLTALTQLVGQVQQPFSQMTGIMPKYYSALTSASRLMEIEKLQEDSIGGDLLDAKKSYEKMLGIELEDVDFSYDAENPVLVNCSAYIKKGDFVSITGMSGIGKSSLFKVLLDIYPKIKGKAYIVTDECKIHINGLSRTMFAYVPQGNMLFSGTIKENLLFVTEKERVTCEEINHALKCACANEFIDELPEGLDTLIGEKGVGLSEGQIQRISLARAILSGAPVLLLDEATSALDEKTEAHVLENLKNMTDRTCIIVTHRKKALDICNRHLVIENKKIIERDTL